MKAPRRGPAAKARIRAEPPSPKRPRDRRYLLGAAALAAVVLLAFSNSFQAAFVLDNKALLNDPRIQEVTADNVTLIFGRTYWWPTGETGLYRPFTTLSYLFNYAVFGNGDQPAGYHVVNLFLHLANVFLAYALALRLFSRFWPALFAAALWAVHPLATESVTNIVGRADLLSAMGVLAGLLFYARSVESGGWARALWVAAIGGAATLAVFSKESGVAILPLLALYELVCRRRRGSYRPLWLASVASLAPIAAMLYLRAAVLAASPRAELPFTDNPIAGADWWTARLTAVKVMARYLGLMVWPAKLSCDYSYNQIPLVHGTPEDWAACAAVLVAAIGAALLYRRNPACFFMASFAFLNFLPASNLLFPIGTIMADRLIYLPSLGVLACAALAIDSAAARRTVGIALLCILTAGFAVLTWVRNRDWQSELAIATADVRVSPNSFKLHRLVASSLFASDPSHANIDRVIEEQEKSLALLDTLPPDRNSPEDYRLAGYYYLVQADQARRQGSPPEAADRNALRVLLRCVSMGQGARRDAQAHFLLSVASLGLNQPDRAYDAIGQARAGDPLNPQVYRQLGAVLEAQHRLGDAAIAVEQENAIRLLAAERWQEAADSSARVMEASAPEYPAAPYLNSMANLHLGNLDKAEASARMAIQLDTANSNPRALYVLGLVLEQEGKLPESAERFEAYLRAMPNAPNTEVVRRQLANIQSQIR